MTDEKLAAHVEASDKAAREWEEAEYEAMRAFYESQEPCPVCGRPSDYCQGHGAIGDPEGFAVLEMHDEDDHSECHSASACRSDDWEPEY